MTPAVIYPGVWIAACDECDWTDFCDTEDDARASAESHNDEAHGEPRDRTHLRLLSMNATANATRVPEAGSGESPREAE